MNDTVDANLANPNAADANGDTSLRAAIQQANFSAGADTIQFDASISDATSGPIQLRIALDSIMSDITIQGPGSGMLSITRASTAADFRLLNITSAGTLHISNLTLTGGKAVATGDIAGREGGAIYNAGTLYLDGCDLFYNYASDEGGAIYNSGEAYIENNSLHNNIAGNLGGGVANDGYLISINDDIFTNSADEGGGIAHGLGTMHLRDSRVFGNYATTSGGGIWSIGDLDAAGGEIVSNSTGAAGEGGGLYLADGSADLYGVSVSNNSAEKGGAAYVRKGTLTLTNSDVYGNTATLIAPGIGYAVGAAVPTQTGAMMTQPIVQC